MRLHYKTLLCVCGSLLVLMIALFLVWQYIVVDRFGRVEKEYANQNMERAVSGVDQDITSVATGTSDWAIWDDTYIFAEDRNQGYVDANFAASSFTSLRMNIILVLDTSGQLIYGEAFDLESEKMVPIPSSFLQHLSGNSPLLQHQDTDTGTQGILLLPEGPILVAAKPILNSQGEGPARGTLIMARYFDAGELEHIGTLTLLPLTSYPLDAVGMPSDFQTAQASLAAGDTTVIEPLRKDSIAGYALLDNIDGNPALILRAEMPRYIHNAGQSTVAYALISLTIIGLVVGAAIVVMLQITVLSRLTRLGHHVENIAGPEMWNRRSKETQRTRLADWQPHTPASSIT